MKSNYKIIRIVATIGSMGLLQSLNAAVTFQVNYVQVAQGTYRGDQEGTTGGINDSGVDQRIAGLVQAVVDDYATRLVDYRDTTNAPAAVVLSVSSSNLDPTSGTLAFAAPTGTAVTGQFEVATGGIIHINSRFNNLTDDELTDTIFHEFGHVVGIGSLWTQNNLIDANGQFIGEKGLEKFQRDFSPTATFVPVEDAGGAGTAGGHWDEGTGLVGINPNSPYNGRSFDDEILTGIAGVNEYLSDVTLGAYFDLGYEVNFIVPEGPFYWDAGNPTNDGAITSADGIWDLVNSNFSNEDGSENAPYVDGSLVVFGDKGSQVTLAGVFSPKTINIEADGYTFLNGGLNTDAGLTLSILDAAHTLNLNSPIAGTGSLTLGGPGTVNNLNSISSEVLLNSGTLLINGTGTLTGNVTIAQGATLQTDDGGLGNSINVTNNGSLEITADQTIQNYVSAGTLFGAGKLTASSFALNDGATVNTDLLNGDVTTNGAVAITKATTGNLIVQSGVTNLTGSNAGNVNIASGGQLSSVANALSDTAAIVNAGTLRLQGDETVATYNGTGGVLTGSGNFVVNSFTGGKVETQVSGAQALGLTVNANGGAVTLGAGSSLKFDTTTGEANVLDVFPLFTNTSGIVGDATSIGFETFDTSALNNGVKAVFDVTTGNIIITSSNATGSTKNSSAIASALLGATSNSAALVNVNGVPGASQAILNEITRRAGISATDNITIQTELQEISPEVYGSVADYSLRQHLSYTDTVRFAPYMVRSGKFQVFAGANSQNIETKSSLNDADYELKGNGGYFGVAQELNQGFRVGIYGAYDNGDITSDRLNLESSGTVFGAFAEFDVLMPWENDQKHGVITAGVSLGSFDFDGTRTAQGVRNTVAGIKSTTLEFGLGYKTALIDNVYFKLSPFISANHITAEVDGFSESVSANSVSVRAHEKSLFLLNYGLEAEWRPTADAFGFTAKVAMQNNFGDENAKFDSAFATGNDFSILSPGLSERTIEGRVGMFFEFNRNARIGASYFMLSGDDIETANGGNIGISLQW